MTAAHGIVRPYPARQVNRVRLRLRHDRSGATALEFALVVPVVLLMAMAMVEFGIVLFVQSVLEGANTAGGRIGKAGYSPNGQTREQYIRAEVQRLSGNFLNPQRLRIEMLTYPAFGNIGQPEPCFSPASPPCPGRPGVNFSDVNGNGTWDQDMGRAAAGGAGDVVVYRTTYPWRIVTPLLWPIFGDGAGNYNVQAVSVVRNEPL